jgi:Fe2+ or Zn2+ uptake regulation protein
MDQRTIEHRLQAFEQRCRDEGVPCTVQRRTVLEAVLALAEHPTADQVYAVVAARQPGISRATVYRTLETLVRMGLITKACTPGKAIRFDTRIEVHHHLVCLSCDTVIDLVDERLDALPIPDTSAQGFVISDFRVQLRGLCRRCREKEEKR